MRGYNPLKGDDVGKLMVNCKPYLYPDNVTPLMKKYYERKERLKKGKVS